MGNTNTNFKKMYAIKEQYKKQILKACNNFPNTSGIYFLTRTDESGIHSFYIGQSVKMLDRMISHMQGYDQHVDLSLRKRGFYDPENNPYAWRLNFKEYPIENLDEMEQYWILEYQKKGYQARYNKTSGSQGVGKKKLNDYKPSKTYRQGITQGRKSLAKELSHIIDLHLEISLKKPSKVSEKAYEKFKYLLSDECYEEGE